MDDNEFEPGNRFYPLSEQNKSFHLTIPLLLLSSIPSQVVGMYIIYIYIFLFPFFYFVVKLRTAFNRKFGTLIVVLLHQYVSKYVDSNTFLNGICLRVIVISTSDILVLFQLFGNYLLNDLCLIYDMNNDVSWEIIMKYRIQRHRIQDLFSLPPSQVRTGRAPSMSVRPILSLSGSHTGSSLHLLSFCLYVTESI